MQPVRDWVRSQSTLRMLRAVIMHMERKLLRPQSSQCSSRTIHPIYRCYVVLKMTEGGTPQGKKTTSIQQINQSKHSLYTVKQHRCQDLSLPALRNTEHAACGNSKSLTRNRPETWGKVSCENKDRLRSLVNGVWSPRPHPACRDRVCTGFPLEFVTKWDRKADRDDGRIRDLELVWIQPQSLVLKVLLCDG